MGQRGELFSTKVLLHNRTYFFNVKENRVGDLYLNIVESKNRDEGGFDRQSVILFADDLQDFLKGFDEALRVLETSGLVVTSPRKGTVVSEFAAQSLKQFCTIRAALEGTSCHLAVLYMTDAEHEALAEIMEEAGQCLKDDNAIRMDELNSQFHRLITEFSRNSYLAQLIETQTTFIEGFRRGAMLNYEARKISYEEHVKILKALRSGDSELADALMRQHINRSALHTLNTIEQSERKRKEN